MALYVVVQTWDSQTVYFWIIGPSLESFLQSSVPRRSSYEIALQDLHFPLPDVEPHSALPK